MYFYSVAYSKFKKSKEFFKSYLVRGFQKRKPKNFLFMVLTLKESHHYPLNFNQQWSSRKTLEKSAIVSKYSPGMF